MGSLSGGALRAAHFCRWRRDISWDELKEDFIAGTVV